MITASAGRQTVFTEAGDARPRRLTIGAAIVAYHTSSADLSACLHGLRMNDINEIVIVDNSPSPSLENVARRQQARYLPQSANGGFAAAANRAAAQLQSDCFLFINPDAKLEKDAVRRARRYLAGNKQCGIIGFLLVSSAGEVELSSFGAIVTPLTLFGRPRRPSAGRTGAPASPRQVGWTSGGALLIRRRVFVALNGFDPGFFLYWEDVDLCRRALAAGWHTVLLPRPGAVHRRGASLADSKKKAKLYDESADKYFCKHYAKAICLPLRYLRRLYRLLLPSAR
jgi:N-acetylglucosaminyl-diphospho-decaprenol L-rhamnosyltransferase